MSDDIKITPAVRERLTMLENDSGQLTPAVVVADARQKESPLHMLFDWNLRSAAEKHWLNTARAIIRCVKVVVTTETITVKTPHYVRDPSVSGRDQGYVSIEQLQKDPVSARQSILLEFGRAESALKRARTLGTVLNLEDEIEALVLRLLGVRSLVAGDSQPESRAS